MRVAISVMAGAAFGFGTELWHVAILVLLVVTRTARTTTICCVFAYAAVATLPVAFAAHDYGGASMLIAYVWSVPTLVFTALMGGALTLPGPWRASGVVLAVIALSVPPLASISMLSPLPVAGLVFPGFGTVGLAVFLAVLAMVSIAAQRVALITILMALGAASAAVRADGLRAVDEPVVVGIDTWRGQPDARTAALFSGPWRMEEVRISESLDAATVVFPESVYGEWTALTGATLAFANRRLIGGARHYVSSQRYVNTLVDGRTGKILYAQRAVIPVAIEGRHQAVTVDSLPDTVDTVDAIDALLCIELANPWLSAVTFAQASGPVIWAANLGWSSRPSLARRMRDTARQWGRLYGTRLVIAVNHAEREHA